MTLTEKDVRYVAELAHLELTEDEVSRFVPQLGAILEYVQKLNLLDTTNVEPMSQVIASGFPGPPMRSDDRQEPLSQEAALANAPETGAGCFKVPKVIEKE